MTDENKNQMTEKQKVKEITDKLEKGLKELFESEKYMSYLRTMSKFQLNDTPNSSHRSCEEIKDKLPRDEETDTKSAQGALDEVVTDEQQTEGSATGIS